MSMPAVTLWCWDMAGVLLPVGPRFGPTLFYVCHRRLRAEQNLGLLIPFESQQRAPGRLSGKLNEHKPEKNIRKSRPLKPPAPTPRRPRPSQERGAIPVSKSLIP